MRKPPTFDKVSLDRFTASLEVDYIITMYYRRASQMRRWGRNMLELAKEMPILALNTL